MSLIIFAVLGLTGDVSGAVDKKTAQDAIESVFNISFWNLLPLFLMVYLSFKQVPPFLALMGCALLAGLMAPITQWNAVEAFAGGSGQSVVAISAKAVYGAMANGFVSNSGIGPIDSLFSRGNGKHADNRLAHTRGALVRCDSRARRLPQPLIAADRVGGAFDGHVDRLRRGGRIGSNVIAGDQYVADVLPARMFRKEFQQRGLAPQNLSAVVENAGTVTSVLIPWNSCGAYIVGVLGVSTISYLPYCFFNILSPILAVVFGFLGFKVIRLPGDPAVSKTPTSTRGTVLPEPQPEPKEA